MFSSATEQQSSNYNTSNNSQSPTPSLDASSTGDVGATSGITESPITEALVGQILKSGRPLREVIDEVSCQVFECLLHYLKMLVIMELIR